MACPSSAPTDYQKGTYYFSLPLDSRTYYIQYNQCKEDPELPMETFTAQVMADLEQGSYSVLLLDLRNNGGGYLSQLTDMLDFLLPEGPIFISRDRAGHEEITNSDADCVELPMAVLVNADTYSAAEFFAAELQEQGAAVIVGEPTSGKGYSQQTFPLPHGGAVAISTGAYFTGSGASLIGTGLTLDAEVYNTGAEDTQLAAALELLKIR